MDRAYLVQLLQQFSGLITTFTGWVVDTHGYWQALLGFNARCVISRYFGFEKGVHKGLTIIPSSSWQSFQEAEWAW